MQSLCVARTTTECPLRNGVGLWAVRNVMNEAGTSPDNECALRRRVCLWEIKNAVFVSG